MPSSSSTAQASSGARSANRLLCSASRIACRSAGASARGWTRSLCGTGADFGAAGLARCRRYQVACGTPGARQAARVPILGASRATASSVRTSARARCPRSRRWSARAPEVLTGPLPRSGRSPAPAPAWPCPAPAARSARPADQPPGAPRLPQPGQRPGVAGPPPLADQAGVQAFPAQDRALFAVGRRLVSGQDCLLVLRGERSPARLPGHPWIGALLVTGHPSSIAGNQRTVERGHGHLEIVSIPPPRMSVVTEGEGASRQLGREGPDAYALFWNPTRDRGGDDQHSLSLRGCLALEFG